MNLNNTKLIFWRELSDQWRDRRTIFTIVVMPLVLYPLMGMALLQTAQFMRPEPTRALMAGFQQWESEPRLLDDHRFDARHIPAGTELSLDLAFEAELSADDQATLRDLQNSLLVAEPSSEAADALTVQQRNRLQSLLRRNRMDVLALAPTPNSQEPFRIFVDSASDRSTMASSQVRKVLARWRSAHIAQHLKALDIKLSELGPAPSKTVEIASTSKRQGAVWAKLLPFVVLVWALTGAFYPAIDVCAGEKERGTLETLLSSPAKRSEIVAGKLMTVTAFSVMTALLNLLSMSFTGFLVMGQLIHSTGAAAAVDIGFPPIGALPWLILGLIPIAALFSALALALAAFARSSKEGQYYLIPMMMFLLPLMMLSMFPSSKLDIGTSVIPVTGMLLLLRNLMQGEYAVAFQYMGPVLAVTLVCFWLAAKWAVYQFNNESVLFRSSEQFGVGIWLKHLMRDRGLTPTIGEAVLWCRPHFGHQVFHEFIA